MNHYRLKFCIILIMVFGLVSCSVGKESKQEKENKDQVAQRELIRLLEEKYLSSDQLINKAGADEKPELELISPRDGGRVFTNKDLTHVTLTFDSFDKTSGIDVVCGARLTDTDQIEFIEDRTAPYVLVFEKIPEGVQKFMVFSINKKGAWESKIITLTVKKVTTFKIVPKS